MTQTFNSDTWQERRIQKDDRVSTDALRMEWAWNGKKPTLYESARKKWKEWNPSNIGHFTYSLTEKDKEFAFCKSED